MLNFVLGFAAGAAVGCYYDFRPVVLPFITIARAKFSETSQNLTEEASKYQATNKKD